ncbi:MAG: AbrB/MazE/SpoVT family DNA-binding domain-containing protein [Candidatus Schekmanbacteria bacterium]|nr:AbrB/MazE/SpoVT family DNA-binding domain-containing protein [Candidatus Schekmanbacteria bacterium]
MPIVKTTEKGQVVIPAEIRKRYHIIKGTKVIIIDKNGQIILKPVLKEAVREARGYFKKGSSALKTLIEDRKEDSKN